MTKHMTISSILYCALALGCTPQPGDEVDTGDGPPEQTVGASETGGAVNPGDPSGDSPSATSDIDATGSDSATVGGTTCNFVCPEDEETDGPGECDVFAQDCPDDQKCAAFANDGGNSWNSTKCVPISGTKVPGDPCAAEGGGVSGLDDCEKGSMCWDLDGESKGLCVALCTGSQAQPECGDPTTACAVVNDGVLNLCLDRCDPLVQDCPGDDLCLPIDDAYVCVLDASGEAGAAFAPCEFDNACDRGLLCLTPAAATECDQNAKGCCLPFCAISEEVMCPGEGQSCLPVFTPQPPGLEDVGLCSLNM